MRCASCTEPASGVLRSGRPLCGDHLELLLARSTEPPFERGGRLERDVISLSDAAFLRSLGIAP